jgi:hypothetical protein
MERSSAYLTFTISTNPSPLQACLFQCFSGFCWKNGHANRRLSILPLDVAVFVRFERASSSPSSLLGTREIFCGTSSSDGVVDHLQLACLSTHGRQGTAPGIPPLHWVIKSDLGYSASGKCLR